MRVLDRLAAVRLVLVQAGHLCTGFRKHSPMSWGHNDRWSPASWKPQGTDVLLECDCLAHCCTAALRQTHQICPARDTAQNPCISQGQPIYLNSAKSSTYINASILLIHDEEWYTPKNHHLDKVPVLSPHSADLKHVSNVLPGSLNLAKVKVKSYWAAVPPTFNAVPAARAGPLSMMVE